MMGLKYWGEFAAKGGHVIETRIYVKDHSGSATEVRFPGESPVVIEWPETDKIEPLQGSSCTLKLISASDRQFLNLHDSADGDVRLDIYRDDDLYWSGTLDPESYEEPYSYASEYEVSLTFYDFGILERLNWDATGISSFGDIVERCLDDLSGISYSELVKRISTTPSVGAIWNNVYVDNSNFYDEDGQAMTAQDVLRGILQPFALRLIQRSGNIYLYDLNNVYDDSAREVYWTSDDAMLSFDVTYNKAVVTFSPYASADILDGSVNVKSRPGSGVTVYTDYGSNNTQEGFVLRSGNDIEIEDNVDVSYGVPFEMKAALSGSDCCGILDLAKPNKSSLSSLSSNYIGRYMYVDDFIHGSPYLLFSVTAAMQGLSTAAAREKYRMRISLDLLLDVRYNPFEDAGEYNERGNYKTQQKFSRAFIPVMINLLDDDGDVIYHLENDDVFHGDESEAKWVIGAGTVGCFMLTYYEGEDLTKSVLGGWMSNRRCLSAPYPVSVPEMWSRFPSGEYVPLPPAAGRIQMEVYSGIHILKPTGGVFDQYAVSDEELRLIRWMAYKGAEIKIVDYYGKDIDMEDQVDTASVNERSHEECSVETILGTLDSSINSVMSRGALRSYSGIHGSFTRAGVTARLERLLLGTIYSQYAQRCQILSGTVRLLDGAFKPLSDANSSGQYVIKSDSQDLLEDESTVSMVEFYSDEYQEE